jgi:hypothetical protein
MTNFKEPFRQGGNGYLVLRNGACAPVMWELDFPEDGSLGGGVVRGDERVLAKVAQDGFVNLEISAELTAAIAIDGPTSNEVAVKIPLFSSKRTISDQTIVGSRVEGDKFFIEFTSTAGDPFRVIVPTNMMQDYLPILQKRLPPDASSRTSFFRVFYETRIAMPASCPYVCVAFDRDEPRALTSEGARELAADLVRAAEAVDLSTAKPAVNGIFMTNKRPKPASLVHPLVVKLAALAAEAQIDAARSA